MRLAKFAIRAVLAALTILLVVGTAVYATHRADNDAYLARGQVTALHDKYRRSLSAADSRLPKSFLPGAFAYLCPLDT